MLQILHKLHTNDHLDVEFMNIFDKYDSYFNNIYVK